MSTDDSDNSPETRARAVRALRSLIAPGWQESPLFVDQNVAGAITDGQQDRIIAAIARVVGEGRRCYVAVLPQLAGRTGETHLNYSAREQILAGAVRDMFDVEEGPVSYIFTEVQSGFGNWRSVAFVVDADGESGELSGPDVRDELDTDSVAATTSYAADALLAYLRGEDAPPRPRHEDRKPADEKTPGRLDELDYYLPDDGDPGVPGVITTGVAFGAALVWVCVRRDKAAKAATPISVTPELISKARSAESALRSLVDGPWPESLSDDQVETIDRIGRAAEVVLRRAGGEFDSETDPLDLLAMSLLQRRAAVIAPSGKGRRGTKAPKPGEPARSCFFDPRHSDSSGDGVWRMGRTRLTVPVCRGCRTALRNGGEPAALMVARRSLFARRRSQPYFAASGNVYADCGFGSMRPLEDAILDQTRVSR
ncbi:hypothetical protein LWF01_12435 [Saxibacter everestensis]|uniref:TPM domain-containing protein n=1 Tax=Saxibacter everestensis TaxID=2909229 RepID=A0ABY8QRP6_9MICO|nr:hypothetical protein LWF01_12435 [Brevibacteriaceae bacterium ZFBP1038]